LEGKFNYTKWKKYFVTQGAIVWNFLGEIGRVHENLDVLDKPQNENTRQNDCHLN